MSHQLGIPIEPEPREVMRKGSFGAAIELCAELAGLEPKAVQADCHFDKSQWSRWTSGAEGVLWPKLHALMERCGNAAPVLWQLHRCGYDLHSVRRTESETERECRLLREENAALRRLLVAPEGAQGVRR